MLDEEHGDEEMVLVKVKVNEDDEDEVKDWDSDQDKMKHITAPLQRARLAEEEEWYCYS